MKTRIIIIIVCITSFVLSACSPFLPQATATSTPMPTATSTPTVTPSPIPSPTNDVYTFSKEKLYNTFTSADDFLTHPEKVAWSPYDPWTQPDEFKKWLNGDLALALGDLVTIEPNVKVNGTEPISNEFYTGEYCAIDKERADPFGQSVIFGVKHDGVSYPVVVVTMTDNQGRNLGTHAVLLFDGSIKGQMNNEGQDALRYLIDKNVKVATVYMLNGTESSIYLPDAINQLKKLGYDAFSNRYYLDSDRKSIGFGAGIFKFWIIE